MDFHTGTQEKKIGTVRQLVDTVTTEETGRLDNILIRCLRENGYDLEVQKMQTGNFTGKTIIKVYDLV